MFFCVYGIYEVETKQAYESQSDTLQLVLEVGIIMKRDNYMKKPLHLVLKVESSSPPRISTWASCYLLPPSPHCPRTTPTVFRQETKLMNDDDTNKRKMFFYLIVVK